jgi:hypothetical protein
MKRWEKSQASVDNRLLGLPGPHLRHVISMINTCSCGTTYWALTDIDGGYNLGGADFSNHTPRSSQPMVLRFSPKRPIWSQVNHLYICLQLNQEVINHNSHEWDPPFDFYRTLSSKPSVANGKPSR